jgi:hydroxypyruvate reductase
MPVSPAQLIPASLLASPVGGSMSRVMAAALQAADPAAAVNHHLIRQGHLLAVGNTEYDLGYFKRVFLVGAGKACAPMAELSSSSSVMS